mmetsp:Transcript_16298/g.33052  ORF Transcript_16298/g.33052 Transcript_16298/m.33052 type:complete len:504 (+) Transcript_16298:52-1563(+)
MVSSTEIERPNMRAGCFGVLAIFFIALGTLLIDDEDNEAFVVVNGAQVPEVSEPLPEEILPLKNETWSLAETTSCLVTGRWVSSEADIQQEFRDKPGELAEISCLKKKAKEPSTECKCSEKKPSFCLPLGHQRCSIGSLSYSTVGMHYEENCSGNVKTVPRTRQTVTKILEVIGERTLCIVGDSVTLQMAKSLQHIAARYPSDFEMDIKETPKNCTLPWWGCMNAVRSNRITTLKGPRSGQSSTILWLKHYTFEPWEYEMMGSSCDILLYDLGSNHYKNPKHVGRDQHTFRNDLEFAIPRLARIADAPPRKGSSDRIVVYYTNFPQHFPTATGEYQKGLKSDYCHPTRFSQFLDNTIRCSMYKLQQIGRGEINGSHLPSLCPPGDEEKYSLNIPSKDDSDFIFKIPLNPPLTAEGRAEIKSPNHWEKEWTTDYEAHANSTLKGRFGTLYYFPTDLLFGTRGDAHVSAKDCTHYCWNPLLWEAVWRATAIYISKIQKNIARVDS